MGLIIVTLSTAGGVMGARGVPEIQWPDLSQASPQLYSECQGRVNASFACPATQSIGVWTQRWIVVLKCENGYMQVASTPTVLHDMARTASAQVDLVVFSFSVLILHERRGRHATTIYGRLYCA